MPKPDPQRRRPTTRGGRRDLALLRRVQSVHALLAGLAEAKAQHWPHTERELRKQLDQEVPRLVEAFLDSWEARIGPPPRDAYPLD